MWQFGLILAMAAGANAAISGASAGASAGSYGTGLYASNYADDGYYGYAYPYSGGYTSVGTYSPVFPVVAPYGAFGFNNDLYNLIQRQFFDLQSRFQSQFAQQQAFFDNVNRYSQYYSSPSYYSSYAPSYYSAAAASGSVGPGGVYQSASTYPGQTVTRFGPGSVSVTSNGGGPGYQGVSTSAFSSSSDQGGHKTSSRFAETSVNDNGRVTTYRVQS